MGRASCPPRGRLRPHKSVGGLGGHEKLPEGREGGEKGLPLRSGVGPPVPASAPARPRSLAPAPPDRPRCHAASARPSPGLAPAFHRAAPPCPFRRRPWPARVPSPPLRRIGLDATRPRPASVRGCFPRSTAPRQPARSAVGHASPPAPASPPAELRLGARGPARPRARPARSAAPRAASKGPAHRGLSRHVSLIFHVFTVPEIPYFTGFSSRQAR
jgi:hypothetical protein